MAEVLFAAGCSMTEGAELGNIKFDFDETKMGPSVTRQTMYMFDVVPHDHIKHMETYSFPARMAEYLKIPTTINAGEGGSGNGRIARQTIIGVTELLRTYAPKDIFVVISWSSFTRFELYGEHGWWRVIPTVAPFLPNKELVKQAEIHLKWAAFELDYMLTTNFMHMIQVKDFLESRGINYIFSYGISNSFNTEYSRNDLAGILKHQFIGTLYEALGVSNKWVIYDPYREFDKPVTLENFLKYNSHKGFFNFAMDNKYPMGNGAHPLEEAHDAWAQYLVRKITERGILNVRDDQTLDQVVPTIKEDEATS